MADAETFKPALLVVDMQEDFCPPNGSLAVGGGREIATGINRLLNLPGFALKVATRDWHPLGHASFASAHDGPNTRPFVDEVEMTNPSNPSETLRSTLWPDHCIQDTPGAEIIPEVDVTKLDRVLNKGMDQRVEMYSGFRDLFGNRSGTSFDLADYLNEHAITHVYAVGLTGDCCVFHSAMDATKERFQTIVVEDLTRSIGEADFESAKEKLRRAGAIIALSSGPEVERVARS